MRIEYHGHSCFVVEHEGVKVIVDPFLNGNPLAAVRADDIEADAVILTHGHSDHFGDTLAIAARNGCPVIAIHELALFCAEKGARVHGMNIGGAVRFKGFQVKLTPAFHSSSVMDGDSLRYAGEPAGVLLTMGGKTFYHTGDTALFSDMKLIGELHQIDAAAIAIGDNYTMGPAEASLAAEWIHAGTIIPMHYNTFDAITQDGDAFVRTCEAKGIPCHLLRPGEGLEL